MQQIMHQPRFVTNLSCHSKSMYIYYYISTGLAHKIFMDLRLPFILRDDNIHNGLNNFLISI